MQLFPFVPDKTDRPVSYIHVYKNIYVYVYIYGVVILIPQWTSTKIHTNTQNSAVNE